MLVDRVLSSQYLGGTGTTCLILEGGDIVTVAEDADGANGAHIEIVGSIDAGIAAARWSPDEELLLVVTKDGNAIFMSSTFDPLEEKLMTDEDLKASKHVSVGWGKKETQFEGRGAKALRDPTIPLKVDQGVLSARDDGATTISWRGDGAFVAVNSIAGGRRVVRVYSREGELDSASEPVDGLESSLSWRPSGNLIAGIQRFVDSDRVDVVFFERNGLRHGEFTLRSTESPVTANDKIQLEWNSDSTVLAVILNDLVQLWTMGNYHWYLKQEIPMGTRSVQLAWHPERALRLAAISSNSAILAEQIFYTARGSCRPPYDIGAVAVIDGKTVKMTPFRTANVPPPMSLFEIQAESSVIDVAFGGQNHTFAVLHHRGVDVYEWPSKNGRATKPQHKATVPFETANIPEYHAALRICCSSDGSFHCMNYQDDIGHIPLGVHAEDTDRPHMSILDDHDEMLVATATYEDESSVAGYAQDTAGRLFKLAHAANEMLPVRFPVQLPWFEVSKVQDSVTAFGLSRNGHLYANSRLLTKNCTSFTVTPSHVIFTTSNNYVKFIHLTAGIHGKLSNWPPLSITIWLINRRQSWKFQAMILKMMNVAVAWSAARDSLPPYPPT
jgi:elongator complex protein 1